MTDEIASTQPEPAAAEPEVTQPAPAPGAQDAAASAPTPAAEPDVAQPVPTPPVDVAPAASSGRPRGGGALGVVRSLSIGVVFFLTCLSLVLATTTWWLHDTLLSTDRFVALTAPLASSPAVQGALVEATTNQVDQALDLGPLGQYAVAGVARELYSSPAFETIWSGAMRVVHKQVVAVLRDDSNVAAVVDGKIVVNLFPVIATVLDKVRGLEIPIVGTTLAVPTLSNPEDPDASRAELEAALGRPLKPTFGLVPIADATRLETAQRYVTLFDTFVIVLFVLAALLAILTLALSRHRLRMVALLGLGALVALLAARLIVNAAADGLVTGIAEAGPGAIIGGQIAEQIAASYREFARVILLLGLVAAVVATAAAWLVERRARAASGPGQPNRLVDGWFLALVGLSLALAALILVGLTVATFVLVAIAYAVWLSVVIWTGRRAASGPAPATA
jgi:hypothetical protein